MSDTTTNYIKNPILANKYDTLRTSTDPVAQKIVLNVTNIYNNTVIFNSSKDIQILDRSILDIQNDFNDLIKLATPCASISNTDKCSTPTCNFVAFIENIFLDLVILLSSNPAFNDSLKSNYDFINFFIVYYFSNMIISNPNNQDKYSLPKIVYTLCSGQSYQPSGLSASQKDKYDALLSRMTEKQETTIVRQESNNSINLLLYILLPSVVFIVLVLLYIKQSRQAAIDELDLKEALAYMKKK
jgi:hypothetical protein